MERGLGMVSDGKGGLVWDKRLNMKREKGQGPPSAVVLLSEQPDFKSQLCALEELIISRGHLVERYPKYHCELNPTEKVWGYSKRVLRKICGFTFPKLVENVGKVLAGIPPDYFMAISRSSWRYILAYGGFNGEFLTAEQVKFMHKKYSSHRNITAADLNNSLKDMEKLGLL
jgi:hypothetical protein